MSNNTSSNTAGQDQLGSSHRLGRANANEDDFFGILLPEGEMDMSQYLNLSQYRRSQAFSELSQDVASLQGELQEVTNSRLSLEQSRRTLWKLFASHEDIRKAARAQNLLTPEDVSNGIVQVGDTFSVTYTFDGIKKRMKSFVIATEEDLKALDEEIRLHDEYLQRLKARINDLQVARFYLLDDIQKESFSIDSTLLQEYMTNPFDDHLASRLGGKEGPLSAVIKEMELYDINMSSITQEKDDLERVVKQEEIIQHGGIKNTLPLKDHAKMRNFTLSKHLEQNEDVNAIYLPPTTYTLDDDLYLEFDIDITAAPKTNPPFAIPRHLDLFTLCEELLYSHLETSFATLRKEITDLKLSRVSEEPDIQLCLSKSTITDKTRFTQVVFSQSVQYKGHRFPIIGQQTLINTFGEGVLSVRSGMVPTNCLLCRESFEFVSKRCAPKAGAVLKVFNEDRTLMYLTLNFRETDEFGSTAYYDHKGAKIFVDEHVEGVGSEGTTEPQVGEPQREYEELRLSYEPQDVSPAMMEASQIVEMNGKANVRNSQQITAEQRTREDMCWFHIGQLALTAPFQNLETMRVRKRRKRYIKVVTELMPRLAFGTAGCAWYHNTQRTLNFARHHNKEGPTQAHGAEDVEVIIHEYMQSLRAHSCLLRSMGKCEHQARSIREAIADYFALTYTMDRGMKPEHMHMLFGSYFAYKAGITTTPNNEHYIRKIEKLTYPELQQRETRDWSMVVTYWLLHLRRLMQDEQSKEYFDNALLKVHYTAEASSVYAVFRDLRNLALASYGDQVRVANVGSKVELSVLFDKVIHQEAQIEQVNKLDFNGSWNSSRTKEATERLLSQYWP